MGSFMDAEQEIKKLCEPLKRLNTFQEVENLEVMQSYTLKRLVLDGEIQAIKIRGQWKVFKSEIEGYLLNNLSRNNKRGN